MQRASDIHLEANMAPVFRIDGRLERLSMPPLDPDWFQAIASLLFESEGPRNDATVMWRKEGCVRAHLFAGISGQALALRLLPETVPHFEDLDLPQCVAALSERSNGLVLVTGPTGSGKSTLLAALIDRINRTQARHIITLEDPVEYRYEARKSLIRQREVGKDVASFADGVYSALRADPDVLLIGELRSPETIQAALWAAETGHLVLATLHTRDAAQAVERIVGSFEGSTQAQIRASLSQSLAGTLAVRLVPLKSGGRRACAEIMIATDAIRNLIRESRTHLIRNAIATSRHAGMQTLESHLNALLAQGCITEAAAAAAAQVPDELRAGVVA
jgi:twitching motility protein PilT